MMQIAPPAVVSRLDWTATHACGIMRVDYTGTAMSALDTRRVPWVQLPRSGRRDPSHSRGIPRGPMRFLVLTPGIPQDPAGFRGISLHGGR